MRYVIFVLAVSAAVLNAVSMRRIAKIPSGPHVGKVICCDSNHDSLPEMYFYNDTAYDHEIWEHQGWNRFKLVYEDTGANQLPSGVDMLDAVPFAAGDVDGDGLTDVVCVTTETDSINPDTFYDDVITIESPDSFSYPSRLSWCCRCGNNYRIPFPTYYLNNGGRRAILSLTPDPAIATGIWENVGNDSNQLVWHYAVNGYRFAFGDFDLDGRMHFATSDFSDGIVSVWECTGDDQYQVVYQDTVWQPNGADVFMTNDIDGDGFPEFYVAYENVPRAMMYLYMWQATQAGSNVYHRTLVDSLSFGGDDWGRWSECGDIDGDGIDECIWTTPAQINIYKAVGKDSLHKVWNWWSDHGSMQSLVSTVYDVNNDGYKELITAGNGKISIFEVDAVDLVSPNKGTYKPGDTIPIRWATHTPPRCDSLSLFLRVDSLWKLDRIATGISGTDTLYRWVVPAWVPDTGRIVVMAYGPGHQYTMSDSVIHFTGEGVAEGTRKVPLQWALSVSPNPARGQISVLYDVPRQSRVSVGVYDAGGRLVRSLSEGNVSPGRYKVKLPSDVLPAGIYFLRLDTPGFRSVKKAVVAR